MKVLIVTLSDNRHPSEWLLCGYNVRYNYEGSLVEFVREFGTGVITLTELWDEVVDIQMARRALVKDEQVVVSPSGVSPKRAMTREAHLKFKLSESGDWENLSAEVWNSLSAF